MLKGIDVSSAQSDLDINSVAADFAIIKATGGTGYVNPHCDIHYQQAKAGNRKRGVYHYRGDGYGYADPVTEADFFVDNITGYIGDAILILDWERGNNPDVSDVAWAKAWLDHVSNRTAVKPLMYMSLSIVKSFDWSSVIAGGYGLWCADYVLNSTPIDNYQIDSSLDPNPTWDGDVNNVLWQFTSTGRLDGYGANLDCNFFYGDEAAWDAYARVPIVAPAPTPTPTPEATPPVTTPPTEVPVPPVAPVEAPAGQTTLETTTPTTTQTNTPFIAVKAWVVVWTVLLAIFNRLRGAQK